MKIIIFLFIAINLFSFENTKTFYFDEIQIKCPKFRENGLKFNTHDLSEAIKSDDLEKIKEILDSNLTLATLKNSDGLTPFKLNLKTINSIQIEDMLLCADDKVFEQEVYPPLVLMDEDISDEESLEILKKLLDDGLGINDSFFDFHSGGTTLLDIAYYAKKMKTFDYLLKNGAELKSEFANSVWFDFMGYFRDKNSSFTIKQSISKELLELVKTKEYEKARDDTIWFINYLQEHDYDINNHQILYKTFEYLEDEKGIQELKNLKFILP